MLVCAALHVSVWVMLGGFVHTRAVCVGVPVLMVELLACVRARVLRG